MGGFSCGCNSTKELPSFSMNDQISSTNYSQPKAINNIKQIYSLTDKEDNIYQEKLRGRHSRTFRFEINDGGYLTNTSVSSGNKKLSTTKLLFRKEIKTTLSKQKLLLDNAEAISTLEHDSIVKVFKVKPSTKENDTIVVDSSFIEGSSMRKIISQFKTTNEKLIRNYLFSILEGLKYLHEKGIIHKNLTLDNIIITDDSKVKITDAIVDNILLGDKNELMKTYIDNNNSYDNIILNKHSHNIKPYMDYLEYIPPFFVQDSSQEFNQSYDLWFLGCVVIQLKTGKGPWRQDQKELYTTSEEREEFINMLKNTTRIPKIPDDFSESMKSILQLLFNHNKTKSMNVYNILHAKLKLSQGRVMTNESKTNSTNVQIVSMSSNNTGMVNNLTPVVSKNEQLKNYLNSKGNASFSVSYLSDSNYQLKISSLQNSSLYAHNVSILNKSNKNNVDKQLYVIDDEQKHDNSTQEIKEIEQSDSNECPFKL